jgi:hypothetical protein
MGAARGEGVTGWPRALRFLADLLGEVPPATAPLDAAQWREFAQLVIERHRVAPPVVAALEQSGITPPEEVLGLLRTEARRNALEALAQKAETARLLPGLAARGCRPMLLKGWPLAEELTGSVAGRHSKDLDLYIRAGELRACCEALSGLGYEVVSEHRARLPLIADPALRSECNDIEFQGPGSRQVEVHWRSSHFRGWPDLREICGEGRDWRLDDTGLSVRVPTVAGNLVYLALHGQQHAWLRLKWLHDIALIARRRNEAALHEALQAARAAGAERALVSALHLTHRVFGTPLPAWWPAPGLLARRMLARFLCGIAMDAAAPGSRRARFDFYYVGLVMGEGPAQRLGVLRYAFWRGPRLLLAAMRPAAATGAA